MRSTAKELLATLDKIQNVPILVVGDLVLDRYVWGEASRLSPEAPVPIVSVNQIEDRLGGAGNVIRNLCEIGVKVEVCGLIGDDKEGRELAELVEECGVATDGLVTERGRATTLKTRIVAQRQQLVRVDREDSRLPPLAQQEELAKLVGAKIESAKAVIVSDYGKGAISSTVLAVLEKAHEQGLLGRGARPLVVDPHPTNFGNYRYMTVAKPNRAEAERATGIQISGREGAREACEILLGRWNAEMMMISLGSDGLVLLPKQGAAAVMIDTAAREVFDVSGAGDTLCSVLAAALAVGATPEVAGELGNIAAGIVVSEVGTAAVSLERLRERIEYLASRE